LFDIIDARCNREKKSGLCLNVSRVLMFIAKIAHRIKEARRMVIVPAAWKLLASPISLVAVFYLSFTVFLGRTRSHVCTHLWTPKWAEAFRY
jgi:low temperature requirement protein LtrA